MFYAYCVAAHILQIKADIDILSVRAVFSASDGRYY